MDTISGTFIKQYKDGFIMLRSNGEFITCAKIPLDIKKGTPLLVNGSFDAISNDKFSAESFSLDCGNRTAIIKFLSGRSFKGIGKSKAGKVYDKLMSLASSKSLADFTFFSIQELTDILNDMKIDAPTQTAVIPALLGVQTRNKIYGKISAYGGTYGDVEKIYHISGEYSLETLKHDPYSGVAYDLPFFVCDNIAYSEGIAADDERRINALMTDVSAKISNSGSCCGKLKTVVKLAELIQKKSAFPVLSNEKVALSLMNSDKFIISESAEYGILVYPKECYYTEIAIAAEIKRLINSAEKLEYKGYRGASNLDKDQFAAMDKFMVETGIKILTGGPGTGKTTTIKEFINEYQKLCPKNVIRLCAPTGRAAVKISESTNNLYKASTVHKLLGIRVIKDDFRFTYNKKKPLPKGLYIADEMSMEDESMFLKLLCAIPNGSMLILSGDPGQLPSVSSGTVLYDLIKSGIIPCVTLTTIHRQGQGCSIIENYYKIKNGQADLKYDKDFRIFNSDSNEQIMSAILNLYQKSQVNKSDLQILTFMNKGYLGKDNINETISRFRNTDKKYYFRNTKYAVGDKIMMMANNYAKGYFNGDVGTITGTTNDGVMASFYDGVRTINYEDFSHMDHSWACTVHKSQGSEYDFAIIVVDDSCSKMLYNAIILTAVTRAKKAVYILNKNNALNTAITSFHENERVTGLTEMLKKTM
jgi:exodeoxyribonuclease V alpha subunit